MAELIIISIILFTYSIISSSLFLCKITEIERELSDLHYLLNNINKEEL